MENHHIIFTSNCENKNNSRNVKTKGLASSASKLGQMYYLFFKLHKETPVIAFPKPSFQINFFWGIIYMPKNAPSLSTWWIFDIYVPM